MNYSKELDLADLFLYDRIYWQGLFYINAVFSPYSLHTSIGTLKSFTNTPVFTSSPPGANASQQRSASHIVRMCHGFPGSIGGSPNPNSTIFGDRDFQQLITIK